MKILHIISSGGMYGAEAVILNLSRVMNEGPHRSLLGVFSNSSNPNLELHERALKEGIESHLVPCSGQIDRAAVAGIRHLVAQTGANVVHAHGYKADIYVYCALRKAGIPVVSTCHNWVDNDRKAYLYGVLDRFILRYYARVVVVSEEVRKRLLQSGAKPARVRMVTNGIDLRPFDRAAPAVKNELNWQAFPIVGLVGRLSVEKGVDVFLQSAARVLAQCPDAKFVVAGDGPDRAALQALIAELGIGASVCLLGRRDDMPAVYASLDVMVSASRLEGLPMVILEGMASRLPLVATPVGEVPTVVLNGQSGLIVPVGDAEAMAAAIVDLFRDSAKRKQFGEEARKLIEEKFSAGRMTEEYLRIYKDALAEAGKSQSNSNAPPIALRGNTK